MSDFFGNDAGADNLVLDLTDVKESTGGFEALPAGVYEAVVDNVEFKTSSNGNPMLSFQFSITEAPYTNRKVFTNMVLNNPTGVSILKKTLVRLLPDTDLSKFSPQKFADEGAAIGIPCRLKLKITTYNGKKQNNVSEVLAAAAGGSFLDF